MVFCRNLLIYLGASARACVLAAIDRLLAADGVLFIGHADRLDWAGAEAKFTAVGEPGCFAYREAAARRCVPAWPSARAASADTELRRREQRVDERDGDSEPAGSRTTPPHATSRSRSPRDGEPLSLLDQAAELANRGRFDEAIAACERHLRQKGPSASAYYLMGMICQAAGDRRRAEDCFHKDGLPRSEARRGAPGPGAAGRAPRRPRRGRRLPPPRRADRRP